jgi:hypothetical protein
MADSRPAHEGHAGHGNHLTHPRISKAIGCFDDYASSGDQSALMIPGRGTFVPIATLIPSSFRFRAACAERQLA